jgi:hypothetical protein
MKTTHTPETTYGIVDRWTACNIVENLTFAARDVIAAELRPLVSAANELPTYKADHAKLSKMTADLMRQNAAMLAALESAHETINSYSHIPAMRETCLDLQAAISAAKGEVQS